MIRRSLFSKNSRRGASIPVRDLGKHAVNQIRERRISGADFGGAEGVSSGSTRSYASAAVWVLACVGPRLRLRVTARPGRIRGWRSSQGRIGRGSATASSPQVADPRCPAGLAPPRTDPVCSGPRKQVARILCGCVHRGPQSSAGPFRSCRVGSSLSLRRGLSSSVVTSMTETFRPRLRSSARVPLTRRRPQQCRRQLTAASHLHRAIEAEQAGGAEDPV